MIVSCSASDNYRNDNIDCKYCDEENPNCECPYLELDDSDEDVYDYMD
mgnify:CR=1 FL=1